MKKFPSRYSPRERIEAGCIPEPNSGCWLWLESTNAKGYAHLRYGKVMHRGNRFSWMAYNGKIPSGKLVLHRCDNPICVNPDHLFLGTPRENNDDRDRKGRQRSPRGSRNANSRLTMENVLEIRNSTMSAYQLAKKFNVTPRSIYLVMKRQSWSHI